MTTHTKSLVAVCLVFLLQPAHSQEAAQTSAEGALAIEEILVTAERRSASLQDTPIAISAMTGEELDRWNLQNAEDFSALVPGLWIGNAVGNLQISLRGVSSDSFFLAGDSPVAFNVDGVFRGRQTGGNASFMDAERVEVLKGPQGTLYGRNATAGAINVITNKPTQELGGFFEVEAGDYNLFGVRGVLNLPVVEDKFAMRLAVIDRERDGYWNNGPLIQNNYSDVDEDAYRLHGLYTPTDRLSILLTAGKQNRGGAGEGTQVLPEPDGVLSELEDPYTILLNTEGVRDDYFETYSTEINYDFDAATLTYIGANLETHVRITVDFDRTPVLSNPLNITVDSQQWSHELRLASSGDNKIDWLVGAFYFDEDAQRYTNNFITLGSGALLNTATTQPDFQVVSKAVFGQASLNLTDDLTITAGLRNTTDEKSEYGTFNRRTIDNGTPVFTYGDNEADWSSTDWLIGADWYPVPDTMVYGKVSTGYKSGGFNNVLAAEDDGPVFKPEEILAYQVGHKSQFRDNSVQMNSEVFYYEYTDLQVNQLISNVNYVRNAAEATIFGVDTDIAWLVNDKVRVDLGLSYLDATYDRFSNFFVVTQQVEDLAGSTMSKAPEWSGRFGLEYNAELNGWQVIPRLSLSWASDTKLSSFDDPGQLQESWTRTDLSLDLLSPRETWLVQLFATNLEDEMVFTNGGLNGSGVRTLTGRPPRMYGVRLRYSYQ